MQSKQTKHLFLTFFRTSFSSIGSPSSQEDLQSPTGKPAEKLGTEEEEDNAYTTYHPRPIAVSTSV